MLASSLNQPSVHALSEKALEEKRTNAVRLAVVLSSIVSLLIAVAIFLPYQNFSTSAEELSALQTVRVTASESTELTFDSVGSNFTVFLWDLNGPDMTLLTGTLTGANVDPAEQTYSATVVVPEGTYKFGVQNASVQMTFAHNVEVLCWFSHADAYLAVVALLGMIVFIIGMVTHDHYSKGIRA